MRLAGNKCGNTSWKIMISSKTDKYLQIGLIIIIYLGSHLTDAEIFLTEDRQYEPIQIKVPMHIWKQAIKPTPILKSTATIVVPIHVQGDLPDDEEYFEEENEIVNDQVVVEEVVTEPAVPIEAVTVQTQVTEVLSDPVQQVTNVTEAPVQADTPVTTRPQVTGQLIRFPCSCVSGQCGCCSKMILPRLPMNACTNISFNSQDFVFDVRMTVNNNTVLRRRVSASDPPPICFNPARVPFVRVCAEISNIRIRNRNAYACLDVNADVAEFPVYSASFRCFGLGASGLQTGLKPKPVSSGPRPVSLFGNNDDDDDDDDILGNAAEFIFGRSMRLIRNSGTFFRGSIIPPLPSRVLTNNKNGFDPNTSNLGLRRLRNAIGIFG